MKKHSVVFGRVAAAAVLVAALGLGACSSHQDPVPIDNGMSTSDANVDDVVPQEPAPLPTPSTDILPPANVVAPLPSPTPEAPDAQVLDDASTTGMTARADRGDRTDRDTPVEQDATQK